MRRSLLVFCFAAVAFAADSRPRIRAVTAFISIDRNDYAAKIEETQKFLATAKEALNRAGFEGAGGRITTEPFPVYTKGIPRVEALDVIRKPREAATTKARTGLNIGSAMLNDNDDTAPVPLLTDVLSSISVNANMVMADERGIHWHAIHEAAKLIKEVSQRSSRGDGNSTSARSR